MCFLLQCHLDEKALWQIAKSPPNGNLRNQPSLLYLNIKVWVILLRDTYIFSQMMTLIIYTCNHSFKLQRWNLWSKSRWGKLNNNHTLLPCFCTPTESVYVCPEPETIKIFVDCDGTVIDWNSLQILFFIVSASDRSKTVDRYTTMFSTMSCQAYSHFEENSFRKTAF